ncbi:MAG: hypothetical protein ACOYM3_20655 [Terrimicrobiaceae bacterium]
MKLVTIGFALAGAAVSALVIIIPAFLAAAVVLLNENPKQKEENP